MKMNIEILRQPVFELFVRPAVIENDMNLLVESTSFTFAKHQTSYQWLAVQGAYQKLWQHRL
jgi:hypothetical protein